MLNKDMWYLRNIQGRSRGDSRVAR